MTTEVANRIKKLRAELDLSQRDLASVLEVRQATISEWETGNAKPSRGNLRLLADLCHDSRTVFRWLTGKGTRPRLQPYAPVQRSEQSDPAATYGFEEKVLDGEGEEFEQTVEQLRDQLNGAWSLISELEENLPDGEGSSSEATRQAIQAVRRALDAAYHALTTTTELRPDHERHGDS